MGSAGFAQSWIGRSAVRAGSDKSAKDCLSGQPLPQSELVEAQTPAVALVEAYWRSASAAEPGALRSAFQRAGSAQWVDGAEEYGRRDLDRARDPWAGDASLMLSPEPVSFARAGDEPMNDARGVWAVRSRNDPSRIAGYYLVSFERFMFRWGISRIELVRSPAPAPEVTPFCSQPGDIEAHAEREARREARRAQREARRGR